MGVDDAGDRDPATAELLHDHRVGREVEPHPAVLLGDRHSEQPELLHLLDDRLGERVLVVVVLGVGDDLLVRELADHLADRPLFVRLVGDRHGHKCAGSVPNDGAGGRLPGHWEIFCVYGRRSPKPDSRARPPPTEQRDPRAADGARPGRGRDPVQSPRPFTASSPRWRLRRGPPAENEDREGRRRRPRLWRRRRPQPRLGHGAVGILEALAGHLRSNRSGEIAGHGA